MRFLSTLLLLSLAFNLSAKTAQEYLPPDADLDPEIPTPESVLGWEVGDWHVSHDKLVQYMMALAEASPRVSIKTIGYTFEQRPLLQLTISSADKLQNIEALRQDHLDGSGPLVVWLGYSVHGNEASGSNSSMLTAYYLAASRSDFVNELLAGSVVLIDPSINPDGLNRFASWANSNAAKVPVGDPLTRQHAEDWPSGRTNHYWFDLNRDWLPLIHPESKARIAEYHRWLPHVLTDHHEQGGYPGFFFQPGVPTRQNPLTPEENFELTRQLARYHAAALDQKGQPHFDEEAYDDFYYGKGSTYPDINGSIGILFEQKAIRGQALNTSNGTETFQMAIDNQLSVALSTLTGAWAIRDRLQAYQAGFHDLMRERARNTRFRAWIVGDDGDPDRARAFLDTLDLHRIEYRSLGETMRVGAQEFTPGSAWIIPVDQRQFGLLEAIMEQRTTFRDNTFYDVSAWTLPLAYNLPFATVGKVPAGAEALQASSGRAPDKDAPAWAVPWEQLRAPALLQQLLDAGVRVRAGIKPFSAQTGAGLIAFGAGTLIVHAGTQETEILDHAIRILGEAALSGLEVYSLPGTSAASGPDLGSKHFKIVKPIKPLILSGHGPTAYDVGEQWHLLDQRLQLAAPIVDMQNFPKVELQNYTHLLMANGDWEIGNQQREKIEQWIRAGGILVGTGRAAVWAEELCFEGSADDCNTVEEPRPNDATVKPRAYADFEDDKARQVIGGAIVASVIDLSHPLAFGYTRPELPLFRRGTAELKPSNNAYSTPVRYMQDPLMAGYIGEERLDAIRSQPALIAEKQGKGLVVRFANTPLFRGFWRGTEKLFINALYLGQVIESTEMPEFVPQPKPEEPRRQTD